MNRFSVIVPIYNVEAYLPECVESLIHQTYPEFELILVDDGSKDGCPKICDDFARNDHRIKVIHKENAGVAAARQTGVEKAAGDYIVFVDGDDWVDPQYLERFNSVIGKQDVDVVCCGYVIADGKKRIHVPLDKRTGLYTKKELEREIFPELLSSPTGVCFAQQLWCKAYKRKLYQKQQMAVNAVIHMGEDLACTRPIVYHANTVYIMDECLYYYRQNRDSVTHAKHPYKWDGPYLIGRHIEGRIDMDRFDFREQLARRVTRELYIVSASQFRRKEPYRVIRQDIVKHLRSPYYARMIKNCRFSRRYIKGRIFHFAMKHDWTWFMKIHCILRY